MIGLLFTGGMAVTVGILEEEWRLTVATNGPQRYGGRACEWRSSVHCPFPLTTALLVDYPESDLPERCSNKIAADSESSTSLVPVLDELNRWAMLAKMEGEGVLSLRAS